MMKILASEYRLHSDMLGSKEPISSIIWYSSSSTAIYVSFLKPRGNLALILDDDGMIE